LPGDLRRPVLRLVGLSAEAAPEVPHALTERATGLGKALGTQDDEGEHQDDDQFEWTDSAKHEFLGVQVD